MVVWLFAGGGETETGGADHTESQTQGLRVFLESNFKGCIFDRKLPIRKKPGPKPTIGAGLTGQSLAKQIKVQLEIALRQGQCNLILVVDDLDCRDQDKLRNSFELTIQEAIQQAGTASNPAYYVAFAAPEMESWIIADWDNTIARDNDFRDRHAKMRWRLTSLSPMNPANPDEIVWNGPIVPFDAPETFGSKNFQENACNEKLSDLLIEVSKLDVDSPKWYRKGVHSPRLLPLIRPKIVGARCPIFQQFYQYMIDFCK